MKSLLKSFGYAFRGIWYALLYERNMRIHFVCMIYMYSFLGVYDFFEVSRTQFAVLFLANALVVAAELVNTAVERTKPRAHRKGQNRQRYRRRRGACLRDFCGLRGHFRSRAKAGVSRHVHLLSGKPADAVDICTFRCAFNGIHFQRLRQTRYTEQQFKIRKGFTFS